MYCTNCGAKLEEGCIFCTNCGAKMVTEVPQSVPVVTPAANLTNVPVPEVPAQPKAKMDRKSKLILIESILFIVLMIGCFKMISHYTSPNQVALRYFKCMMNNDYSNAYDYYTLTKSDFITKDTYIKVNSSNEAKQLSNYSIADSTSKLSSSDLTTDVDIEYFLKGKSSSYVYNVQLVKEKSKKFLFFDNWKVSPASTLVENYEILVPTNASVTLNDTKLRVNDEFQDRDNSTYDSYLIKELFAGTYDLKVTYPGMEDKSVTLSISENDSSFTLDNMTLSEKQGKTLVTTAHNALRTLLANAVQNSDYSHVSKLFATDSTTQSNMKSNYNTLLDNCYYNYKIKRIKMNSIAGTYETSSAEDGLTVDVTLNYDYDITYEYDSYYSDSETSTSTSSMETTFTFQYVDSKWVLINTSLNEIYIN